MMDETIFRAVVQVLAPVCPDCDYAKAHCRCKRCPKCGNKMERRHAPSPVTADGRMLLVALFSFVCPCCEAAADVRAEQAKAPHGDGWPT